VVAGVQVSELPFLFKAKEGLDTASRLQKDRILLSHWQKRPKQLAALMHQVTSSTRHVDPLNDLVYQMTWCGIDNHGFRRVQGSNSPEPLAGAN
jgi:hypothetical protein